MPASITATNTLALNFQEALTYGLAQTANLNIPMVLRSIFKSAGVLLDQCNEIYNTTLTFTASTPQTLDLTNLTDPVTGATVDFARVKLIAIRNNSTTDGQNLTLGDSVTNEWDGIFSSTGTAIVGPSTANNDGFLLWQAPNSTAAAVSSSHKTFKLDPGPNAFTVDILIAGCNA